MDQLICQTEKGKQKVEKGPLGFRKKSHTSTSGCIGSVCEAVINQGIVESKVPISWHLLYFFTEGTVRERNIKKKKKNTKRGFPGSSASKESACNAKDPGLIPGWGRSAA